MDIKKQAFLKKLRETFKAEATEHLECIAEGLVALENADDSNRGNLLEQVFREAHSLKGASRAVNLIRVEELCQIIESFFAALQKGQISLSAELLDGIHLSLDVIGYLCKTPESEMTSEDIKRSENCLKHLEELANDVQEKNESFSPVFMNKKQTPVNTESEPSSTVTKEDIPDSDNEVLINDSKVGQPLSKLSITDAEIARRINTRETVRVSIEKLNTILLCSEELVGAKIAAHEQVDQLRRILSEFAAWNQSLRKNKELLKVSGKDSAPDLSKHQEEGMLFLRGFEDSLRGIETSLRQDARTLSKLSDELIEDTKRLLLLPCSSLFKSFPPMVRDLARNQSKQVELQISHDDIEIDRRILDELKDPLIHLLRNSIDHGIEKAEEREKLQKPGRGTIKISVSPLSGELVEISLEDDGAGIDPERVTAAAVKLGLANPDDAGSLEIEDLIFHSGLSTSQIITDISGRGLGLAIVREKVEKLGGSLSVTSEPGKGTTFRLRVPLTLTTFRGVFVKAAGESFVIPTANVVRVARIKASEIKSIENRQTISFDQQVYSVVRLSDALECAGSNLHENHFLSVVIVRSALRQLAFIVDEIVCEQEVMVKKLGTQIPKARNFAGIALLGNRQIVPIIDTHDLVESAINATFSSSSSANIFNQEQKEKKRLLIAEDSITSRTLVKSILESAGFEVVTAVDGIDALTRLKSEQFDLVVSDVDMPRLNGFELTSKIRANKTLSEIPVVLVTSLSSQKDREYGIQVGANAYIVKSDFDQGNLLEIIRRLL